MTRPPRILVLDNDAPRHELFRAAAWGYDMESVYQIPGFEQAVRDPDAPGLICLDHHDCRV